MKPAVYLAKFGVSVDQAFDYILAHLSDPAGLFTTLKSAAINTEMVTEIVQSRAPQVTIDQVRAFFASHQLNTRELDDAYFQYMRDNYAPKAGASNNDTIQGTDGDDYIDGGAGNDVIKGGAGNDYLIGGSGNDTLEGGWGADYLEGGLGADVLDAGRLSSGYYVNGSYRTVYDLSSNQLFGGGGDDTLYGGYGPDYLDGGDGADRLYGYEGNDTLIGGAGDDVIYASRWSWDLGDNDVDVIYAGAGNDEIHCGANDNVDAGEGNDVIKVYATGKETQTGVIKPGEGADKVYLYDLQNGTSLLVDFAETNQAVDYLKWELASNHGLTKPAAWVKGFQFGGDQIDIKSFTPIGSNRSESAAALFNYKREITRNYVQFLDSPQTAFKAKSAQPLGPDDYGKGIFVIRNATAASDDIEDVARFLDPYGNNHTYGKGATHYFLVNVSATDMALYRFEDDTGADNVVTPDELAPIVRFVGVTTDSLLVDDLAYSLV